MKIITKTAIVFSVLIISIFMTCLLTSCGSSDSSAAPSQQSSGSVEPTYTPNEETPFVPKETTPSIALSGSGNYPANLLYGGMAVEYDGYVYHIDQMFEGNLWRTSVDGGESELLCKGSFCGLNVNGGLIFSLLSFPSLDSGLETSGICVMNIDGGSAKILKEGYFSRLILNDEYLYYTDGSDGSLYRIKYDGSGEQLLLQEEIYDAFLIINGSLYIYSDLDEEYVTNIYKMPLDGSAPPTMIVKDIFGGIDVALNEIYYTARDNSSNMLQYDTETGEISLFVDYWIDSINTDGEYLYYFWSGAKSNNSDCGLYRMRPDTSDNQMIMQTEELYSLNIAGGKLFWQNNDEFRRLTSSNLNCTEILFVKQLT